jgi:hypothetical protein
MSNAFDMVRKIRHLSGLNLTATIEPQHIPKRVKTAAQKMLRSGVLIGGYTSKSRVLAEQMLDTHKQRAVGCATTWGAFVYDMAMLADEGRAQLRELINAARLVEHANSQNNPQYINNRYDLMLDEVDATTTGRATFHAYNKVINQQVLGVVSACRTPEQVKAHEALADRLDNPEPIIINIYE